MEFSLCPAGSLFERPTKLKKGACSIKRMSLHSGDGRSIRIDTQHLQLVASVSFLEKILGSLSPGQTMQCQHFFLSQPFVAGDKSDRWNGLPVATSIPGALDWHRGKVSQSAMRFFN